MKPNQHVKPNQHDDPSSGPLRARSGPGRLTTLLAASLLAGSVCLPAAAAPSHRPDVRPPAATKRADDKTPGWDAWQTLSVTKTGLIQIRYRTKFGASPLWAWELRSSYDHPLHVDYEITTSDPNGFPVRKEDTTFLAAGGTSDPRSTLSDPMNAPALYVEDVR